MKYSNEWLLSQPNYKDLRYLYFWGHRPSKDGRITKSCFSQWFVSPFEVEGRHYLTAEHWMMWCKAITFNDQEIADQILLEKDPAKIKKLGRRVKNYSDKTWREVRYQHVVDGNRYKFSQNPEMKAFLLSTGPQIIVEASPYDAHWGIGMTADEAVKLKDPAKWRGTNLLGYALMEVRDLLMG